MLGPLCKSSILDTGYDATGLFDFPSFFYLSKGQEREAYQYNKLHIDRGEVSGRTRRSADRGMDMLKDHGGGNASKAKWEMER